MIQLKLITPSKIFVLDPLDGLTIPSNRQLNDSLQHQEAQVSVRVAYDSNVHKALVESTEIQAQILDNNIPVFTGIIDIGISWIDNGNPEPLDNISLVVNDLTYKLQQTTDGEFAFVNETLDNVVSAICAKCGLIYNHNHKAQNITVPVFILKQEQDYYQALNDLLFENLFSFGFAGNGTFTLIDLTQTTEDEEITDLLAGVKFSRTKKKFTGLKLSYGKLIKKENEQIYFEGGNLNEDSKVVPYIITPGSYYPVEATPVVEEENGQVYQDFSQGFAEVKTLYNGEKKLQKSENTQLIYSTDHVLVKDWSDNLTVDRKEFQYTQASVRFYNASETDAELHQLAIKATAYYKETVEYILGTGKKYNYDTSFIYENEKAEQFAAFLTKYFLGGNYKVTFKTDTKLTPGQEVKIDLGLSGVKAQVLILNVTENLTSQNYEVTAITEQEITLDSTKYQLQKSMTADQRIQRTEYPTAIKEIQEEYYLSTSRTVLENGEWTTTPPTDLSDKYIWTRTTFLYENGIKTTTDPISVSGANGDNIESVDVEYAQNQSRTTAPKTGWQTTSPTSKDGYYIWSRTKVKLKDKEATYTDAVCITGDKGAQGSDGKNAITMTSATTPNGEYNGQIGIWQGQIYQWDGSNWKATSGILPTNPVLHYSFDNSPDIFDFSKNTFTSYYLVSAAAQTLNSNSWRFVLKGNDPMVYFYTNIGAVDGFYLHYKVKVNYVKNGSLLREAYLFYNDSYVAVGGYNENASLEKEIEVNAYIPTDKSKIINYLRLDFFSGEECEIIVSDFYIGKENCYKTPVFIDNSGNNNHAIYNDGFATRDGISGKGVTKTKGIGNAYCDFYLKGNYTVSFWCKDIGNNQRTLNIAQGRKYLGDGSGEILVYVQYETGKFEVGSSGAFATTNKSIYSFGDDKWHLYTIIRNNTTYKFYKDGNYEDTATVSAVADIKGLVLGSRFLQTNNEQQSFYSLDDFQIFNKPLSDQEVLGLYLAKGNTPKRFTLNDYRLNLIDDDGVISVSEKKELLRRWKEIYNAENVSTALPTSNITANGEYKAVIDAANLLSIGSISAITTYREATNSLRDAFWGANGYLNNMTTASTLNGNLDSLFANYKQALQNANNAISDQQSAQASAITVQMASPFVQLPVNDSGSVTSYDNSGNVITVLNGAVTLTPVASTATLADNQYSVAASGSGITAGAVSVDSTNKKVTIGNSTAMTKPNAQITYTIKFKINGTTGTLYAQQKISTASRGADGKRGPMYRGTTKPTTDVVYGDWYLDTTDNLIHVYNNSNWNTTVTNYNDYRYTPALNDMLAIAAEEPDVGFIKIVTAHIQNLAAGNILATVLTTKELTLTSKGVIKSENYGETTGGFEVKADGQATFANLETPIISDEGNVCFLRCMTSALVKTSSFTETDFITVFPACIGYVKLEVYLQSFRGQSFSGTLNIGGTSINVSNKKSYVYTKTEYYSSRNSFTNIIFTPTSTSTTSDDYIVMVVSLGSNIQKQSWVYKKLVTESEANITSNDITWHLSFTEKIAKATGKIAVEKSFDGGKDGDKSVPQPILQNGGGNVTGGNIYRFFSTTPFSQGHGAISGLYHTSNQITAALANTVRTHVYWANKNQSASVIINSVAVSLEAEWWNADLGNRSTT